ncbi:MAG: hypothetical protein ABJB66_05075 [Gemmatimonadaceae bacterium]
MSKPKASKAKVVREPAQVYLAPDDSDLLSRLVAQTNLAKAEILRRGIRSFAREQAAEKSPMLSFLAETGTTGWPDAVAVNHDEVLAESYKGAAKKRK